MLKNAYLIAKIGADPTENEQNFAEILPIGRRFADRTSVGAGSSTSSVWDGVTRSRRSPGPGAPGFPRVPAETGLREAAGT